MSRVIVWLENREKTIDGRMLLTVFETEKSFKSKSLEKKKEYRTIRIWREKWTYL